MPRFALVPIATLVMVSGLVGCTSEVPATVAAPPRLDNERARASYVVGLDLAQSVTPLRDQVDIETLILAIRTVHSGKEPLLAPAEIDAVRKQFTQHLREQRENERIKLAAANLQSGAAFLDQNSRREQVHALPSGLQYEVLAGADGIKATATDTVRVHYVGRHLDGAEFENTYATDHPAEFVLGQVMPGWSEGIALMPLGSKYRFWVPAKLAFAETGLSGQVEPNETLVYEVELLEIAGR